MVHPVSQPQLPVSISRETCAAADIRTIKDMDTDMDTDTDTDKDTKKSHKCTETKKEKIPTSLAIGITKK